MMSSVSSSQTVYPYLTVSGTDTIAVFSFKQFKTIRFSISYIRNLQERDTLHLSELNNLDIQIHQRDSIIALERLKIAEKDSINVNLESVIVDYKKARRRERLKSTFAYIGLGILAGVEAGVITYLLIK